MEYWNSAFTVEVSNSHPSHKERERLQCNQQLQAYISHQYTGIVPSQWKSAIVIPVLKKEKDPSVISSYRPISLTSILARTMERMVNGRLNWCLEAHNILVIEQAGFRANRSTNQHVAKLLQCIKDLLGQRKVLNAVFIDLKSAYDTVWKEKLILKLSNYGICFKMLKWFQSFLSTRSCRVKYGSSFSKKVKLQAGLPQGAVTSCSLFNIYVNDLVKSIKSVE